MGSYFRRKRRRVSMRRKRVLDSSIIIDYKNPDILRKFITDRGKIIPSRVSGATHSQQQAIAQAVKRARYLALIPSSIAHEKEKGFVEEMSEIVQSFAATVNRRPAYRGFKREEDDRDLEDKDSSQMLDELNGEETSGHDTDFVAANSSDES